MHGVTSTPNDRRLTADIPSTAALRPLAGRNAVITGSTRGIGEGIARALAEAGCNLLLNGRRLPKEGQRLAKEIATIGGVEAEYHSADLRDSDDVKGLIAFAQEQFGTVDILVNNAGIQHVAPVETFAEACWDEVLSLNLTAAFLATKAVLPGMRRHG